MRRFIFGMMLGCGVLIANAADESLTIGGVRLTLGMERSKAVGLIWAQRSNLSRISHSP
jgi:hypothetical protein